MANARLKVDAELPKLMVAVGELAELGVETEQQRRVQQSLQAITETRSRIDGLQLPPAQSFAYYTGLIGDLLDVMRELALTEKQGSLESRIQASLDLALAKELTGQERGMGNGFIASGRVPPEQFMNFARYHGAGDILLEEFARLEPTLAGETLQRFSTGGDAAVIADYRRQMLQADGETSLGSLDAKEWFAKTTARIEVIHDAELAELAKVRETAEDMAAHDWQEAVVATVIALVPRSSRFCWVP